MKPRLLTKEMEQRKLFYPSQMPSPQEEYQRSCTQSWGGTGSLQVSAGGGGALVPVADQNTTSQREQHTVGENEESAEVFR